MFADDPNLFYSHRNIQTYLRKRKEDSGQFGKWFGANKLSLSIKKTKYTFFFSKKTLYEIIYYLNYLKTIEKANSIKFLVLLLDKNMNWKDLI